MALVYNEQTGNFDDIQSPPIIRFFRIAQSVPFYVGDSINIEWQVGSANHVYIDEEEVTENTKVLSLEHPGHHTIKLRATNADGVAERSIELEAVNIPDFSINTSASVIHKNRNENVVFRWTINNARSLRLKKGNSSSEVPLSGEQTESPLQDTTYIFEATGLEGGRKFEHHINIRVCEASTADFKASRLFSYPNLPINLSWNVKNADSVSLDDYGEQPWSRTLEVMPGEDTTYRLRVTDPFGEHIHSLTVRMLPLPVIKELWTPAPKIERDLAISYVPPKLDLQVSMPTFNSPLVSLNLPEVPRLKESPFFVNEQAKPAKKHRNVFRNLFSYFFDK